MSVTLDHVTRTVDGIPTIRDVSLTLERGTLSVLLGPTLSGKTSIMRLLAGLDKPTTGRVLVDGKDVTGVDVRQRSVAMVYQQFINYPSLTVYENIASPLRVQGKPRAEIESARAGGGEAPEARAVSEPHAAATVRRPAAAHRDRARAGQGRRSGAARRAARQSRLQAARGTAHRTAAHLRGLRRDLRLRHHRAVGSAAARRPHASACGKAAVLQAGDTPKVYRHPDTLRVAQVFSDPPLNIVGIEKNNGSVQYAGGVQAPATGLYAGSPTAPIASASAPISSKSPTASPAATPFRPP